MNNPPVLSIITLTIPTRKEMLERLKEEIRSQAGTLPVEHLVYSGPERYGTLMRKSSEASNGLYICWIDDDDWPMPTYVSDIVGGCLSDSCPDVVTFGSCSPGCVPAWLRANRGDNSYEDRSGIVKSANHYCAWKRELALSAPWLERNYGAEYAWYTALRLAYPALREYHIPKVLHEYRYDPKGTLCQNSESIQHAFKDGANHVVILQHLGNRIIGMAVGPDQPVDNCYTVQLPDNSFTRWRTDTVEILEKVVYR